MKNHHNRTITTEADRPCIVICLRDFSSVRNLLPPDAVDELARSGARIVFLLPDPENTFIRSHLNQPGFVFEKLELDVVARAIRAGRLVEWLREVRFLTYGNSTPSSMGTRKYHVHIFKEEILGAKLSWLGRLYYGSVVPAAHLASRSRLTRNLLVAVEKIVQNLDPHRRLYEKYRPDWLVVPTLGYAHDPLLMREAKRNGAQVLSIVRSWDNTTNKGYSGCRADHVFVWNSLMAEEVHRHHDIASDRIEITGIPHWDVYFQDIAIRDRKTFFADHGLDPKSKVIYYAMSGPQSFRHNLDIIRLILDGIRSDAIESRAQLLVRIHPTFSLNTARWTKETNEFKEQSTKLLKEFSDILSFSDQKIINLAEMNILDPYNQVLNKEIFSYSDVLVNIYSTQMVEGAIFDLPIITAGWLPLRETDKPISVFEEYNHVSRVLATGAVTTTHSPEALISAINADLADRGRLNAERKALVDQEITHHRGSAGIYTAQRIAALSCERRRNNV